MILNNAKNLMLGDRQIDKIMRGSQLVWERKGGLPVGYTKCEYLESTGTQWIDTGVFASWNIGVYAEVKLPINAINKYYVFGACSNGDTRLTSIEVSATKDWYGYGYGTFRSNSFNFNLQPNEVSVIKTNFLNNGMWSVDDKSYTIAGYPLSFVGTVNMALFGYYFRDHIAQPLVGCILSAKVSIGEEIARNFIPALDPSGRPCMYDTVSKQPFYNQGTGEFLYKIKDKGDDNLWVDYITDIYYYNASGVLAADNSSMYQRIDHLDIEISNYKFTWDNFVYNTRNPYIRICFYRKDGSFVTRTLYQVQNGVNEYIFYPESRDIAYISLSIDAPGSLFGYFEGLKLYKI